MKEEQYTFVGWSVFLITIGVALFWCITESGLSAWFIGKSQQLLEVKLVQISCVITLLTLGFPGFVVKRYFDHLAWKQHVAALPPPDIHQSLKRSKYIEADKVPPAPARPVEVTNIPKGQEEFIATCPACGNFFPAQTKMADLKCPSCGEVVPLKG